MIVAVCGMHRSGTSALAGMLHANRICMGNENKKDFYPPPMKENPKGFFENVRFRRINDAILKRVGYNVKSFDPNIPIVPICLEAGIRQKMKELIIEFQSANKNWGWKDPRTSLTFLTWMSVLEDMGLANQLKCLLIMRSPASVASSMLARGNKEKEDGQFELLAMEYTFRGFAVLGILTSNGKYVPCLPIAFESLIYSTNEIAKITAKFLGVPIYETSSIDPEMVRTVL